MTILQNITKWARDPQKIESVVIFSESLEEEGKVSWAAEISKHVVEETDSVQNLGLQFTQAICQDLFYLELAHVGTVPHLVLLEETKEGLPLLQAGRQTLVPRNPVGGQLNLLLKEWKSRKLDQAKLVLHTPRRSPTPWRRRPASTSPWGSSPHTCRQQGVLDQLVKDLHLG